MEKTIRTNKISKIFDCELFWIIIAGAISFTASWIVCIVF